MKKKQSSLFKEELRTVISYISLVTKKIENGANENPQGKNERLTKMIQELKTTDTSTHWLYASS